MVRAQSVTVTLVYTYNAQGLRVAQSVDGVEAAFAWDLAAPLAQVISDSDALYLHGLDLLAQQRGNAQRYYLGDGLGSVRQMVNRSGAVKQRYDYTPYGVVLASQGSVVNAFQYTGEWWDAGVGLQYLRARWYDGTTGRFTTEDPAPGYARIPRSLHIYVYAWNNPVNLTDPAGLQIRPPEECEPGEICYTGTTGPYIVPLPPSAPAPTIYPLLCSHPCQSLSPLFAPLASSPPAQEWRLKVLCNLLNAGPTCGHGAMYIMNNNVQFGFTDQNTGASWTFDGNINLSAQSYSLNTSPAHVYMLSLIVHEARHLEQGRLLALSVLGELDAWQIQYDALVELGESHPENRLTNADLIRMLPSPSAGPVSDADLMAAGELMIQSQGWGYLVWLLPLRPEEWYSNHWGWYSNH